MPSAADTSSPRAGRAAGRPRLRRADQAEGPVAAAADDGHDDVRRRRPVGRPRPRHAARRLLSAGGAGAVNHWYDRDIDAADGAHGRPAGAQRAASRPRAALIFGCVARRAVDRRPVRSARTRWPPRCRSRASWATSSSTRSGSSAARRRTSSSAAPPAPSRRSWPGRRPPARCTGTALYLFAIVFFWTPPHFWALSLLMKDEYARVGVPMLPVVRGEAETRRQILLYTVLLYAVTQLPFCAGGLRRDLPRRRRWCSTALFIAGAVRLYRRAERRKRACACTCSPSPTWRCCSGRWSSTRASRPLWILSRPPWTASSHARTSAPP